MLGKKLILIRAPGQVHLADDSTVPVAIDTRRLHLFDADGKRV